MSWLSIDHNIHRHPKFRDMPAEEFLIWHVGLCYAAEFWTDGFIPASEFPKKSQQKFLIDLQNRNLWHPISQNGVKGFQIHDYLDHQTSKQYQRKKRETDRERKRNKALIPTIIPSGNVEDSELIPSGNSALKEEEVQKKITQKFSGVAYANTPTPVPPRASKDELEIIKNPMPQEAQDIFQELGYRR